MIINVRIYNSKNKLIGYRQSLRPKWRGIYGKLDMVNANKWFVKVVYGRGLNIYGELITFKNEGVYNDLREAKKAFSAFIEE